MNLKQHSGSRVWKKLALHAFILVAILGSAPTVSAQVTRYPNPIGATSFGDLIANLAGAVRTIAIPFAVLGILFSGFKFIKGALGDAKEIQEAKKVLLWVLVGTAIVVAASVLAQAVVNFAKTL